MALFSGAGSALGGAVPASAAAAAPYIQVLARFGYAARGVVYLVIGILAFQTLFSAGGGAEDSSGALQVVLRQPFGRVLLGALAVGLAGWVIWRLFQAIADPEHRGSGAKGVVKRAGYLISALLHAALAIQAVRLMLGSGSGGSGQGGEAQADHWTGQLMQQPAGRWLVAGVGAVIVLFGLYELARALRADFKRDLDLSRLGTNAQRRVVLFGRLGISARGSVFGIIGWFLLRAAIQHDPQEARGFESALQSLQEAGYGQWLLGAIGLGLLCYGLFELAEARYRLIRTT